jgi:hypothetical protein
MFIVCGSGEHQVRILTKTAQGYDIQVAFKSPICILVDDLILYRPYLTLYTYLGLPMSILLEVVSNGIDDDTSQIATAN